MVPTAILDRVVVQPFYKVNLGFFLVAFLLMFGIVQGRDAMRLHHAIMQGIVHSLPFMAGAMAVWAAYNLKCITFTIKQLQRPENAFLYQLQSLDNGTQFRLLLRCHVQLYAPVLAYGAGAVITGIAEGCYLYAGLFLLFQVIMCFVGACFFFRQVNGTWRQPSLALPAIRLFPQANPYTWLLGYSLSRRKATFIAIKLLSILLLQILAAANTHSESREAVCVLMMFLISAHALLPVYYTGFVEDELSFLRNMPMRLYSRWGMYLITYLVVFLPEALFLFVNERQVLTLSEISSIYALAVSQMALYTSLIYIKQMHTERYTMLVFGIFFMTLLFLASFSFWPVAVAELLLAGALYYLLYWKYEAPVGNAA